MFGIEKEGQHITRLRDIAGTCLYLIEGEEKALLVDTGIGAESLKDTVSRLTDKPLTVLITHGHVDHAMGAGEFSQVYMNTADRDVYEIHRQNEMRLGYIRGSAAMIPDAAEAEELMKIQSEDLLPVKAFEDFLPLVPDMSFDLGGLTVQVLDGKGHTPGTVVLLLVELRILILGDACNPFTYLFEPTSSTVESYRNMLLRLKEQTDGRYDRVLLFHGPGDGAPDMIDSVIDVCGDIMEGRVDNIPFESIGHKGLIAKAMNFEIFSRADGGSGNVIYNPDRIFDK